MDQVLLRCPHKGCPRKRRVARDQSDPPGTTVVEVLCDWHDSGGGFPETIYYDANGNQLIPD